VAREAELEALRQESKRKVSHMHLKQQSLKRVRELETEMDKLKAQERELKTRLKKEAELFKLQQAKRESEVRQLRRADEAQKRKISDLEQLAHRH
jgi:hypothetical protein